VTGKHAVNEGTEIQIPRHSNTNGLVKFSPRTQINPTYRQWTHRVTKTFIERTKETHPSYADKYVDILTK
jgi:hypothetical protein